MPRRKSRILKWTLGSLAIIVIGAGAVAWYLYKSAALNINKPQYVYLDSTDNVETLKDKLVKECGLKHPAVFMKLSERMNLQRWIKRGRYTVTQKMTLVDVARIFREGRMKTINLVIKPLTGLEPFAARCGEKLEPDSVDYINILLDSTYLKSIGFTRETIYAMLLPDTYNLLWHTQADELMQKLLKEYNIYWNEDRISRAQRSGLTPLQVSILASIVSKETNKSDEMPLVAGMYINRLRKDMALQADPTIKFAMHAPGLKRIYHEHLKTVSPYNTYLNKGLPPGPICIPSKQAIEAVLNFAENDYLYMCAKEDFSGYHNFAVDYDSHCKNAKRYQAALNEKNIQ